MAYCPMGSHTTSSVTSFSSSGLKIVNSDTAFVSTPDKIINKWSKDDMEYTDWNYKHNTNKAG